VFNAELHQERNNTPGKGELFDNEIKYLLTENRYFYTTFGKLTELRKLQGKCHL